MRPLFCTNSYICMDAWIHSIATYKQEFRLVWSRRWTWRHCFVTKDETQTIFTFLKLTSHWIKLCIMQNFISSQDGRDNILCQTIFYPSYCVPILNLRNTGMLRWAPSTTWLRTIYYSIGSSIAYSITVSITFSITFCIVFYRLFSIALTVVCRVEITIAFYIIFSITSSNASCTVFSITFTLHLAIYLALYCTLHLVFNLIMYWTLYLEFFIVFCIALSIVLSIVFINLALSVALHLHGI